MEKFAYFCILSSVENVFNNLLTLYIFSDLEMDRPIDNVNPKTYEVSEVREKGDTDYDDSVTDPVDAREIFDLIRDINDPGTKADIVKENILF